MASDLIVVDEYYKEIGSYFRKRGDDFEKIGKEYIRSLKRIKAQGICSGETAEALDAYIVLASKLNECSGMIGKSVETMMNSFISNIDVKDRYLF